MKITVNPKDRPTFVFAAASILAATATLWMLFLPSLRSADQAVTRSALSLKKAQELSLSKDSIESKYARIRSTASGDDWVKRLTDVSKRQGVVFDTMLPDDPGAEFPGETGVRVGFRADIGRFSAFIHSLTAEDALCLIRDMKLEKGENGILNCELVLSKVVA